jgi:hypothetical protein
MLTFSASLIRHLFAVVASVLSALISTYAQEGFPVPTGNANQLFYLQRTSNTNTIVCELNYNDSILNEKKPVHVFWIRYAERGQREELSYIQRTFAYGIKTRLLSKDKYELRFVSYKKYLMHLMKATNGKYYVFVKIRGKQAILNRLFIKINGGSFWSPNVEYMEIKGIDITNGNEMVERIKP